MDRWKTLLQLEAKISRHVLADFPRSYVNTKVSLLGFVAHGSQGTTAKCGIRIVRIKKQLEGLTSGKHQMTTRDPVATLREQVYLGVHPQYGFGGVEANS